MVNKKRNIQACRSVEFGSRITVFILCSLALIAPRGRFKVLRKITGWRLSSLGLLYYPNYIHNGIAIHGSLAMKVYSASHGCIRIPMFASKKLSELTPVGTEVIVYD
jgi:lipoprotein-anchoring transpeptidase ErfK/SrfK